MKESIRYTYDQRESNGKVVGFQLGTVNIAGVAQFPVYERRKIEIAKVLFRNAIRNAKSIFR